MKFFSTNKMVAAPFTKPTPRDVFKTHMMSLGLVEFSQLGYLVFGMDVVNIAIKNDVSFVKVFIDFGCLIRHI